MVPKHHFIFGGDDWSRIKKITFHTVSHFIVKYKMAVFQRFIIIAYRPLSGIFTTFRRSVSKVCPLSLFFNPLYPMIFYLLHLSSYCLLHPHKPR